MVEARGIGSEGGEVRIDGGGKGREGSRLVTRRCWLEHRRRLRGLRLLGWRRRSGGGQLRRVHKGLGGV